MKIVMQDYMLSMTEDRERLIEQARDSRRILYPWKGGPQGRSITEFSGLRFTFISTLGTRNRPLRAVAANFNDLPVEGEGEACTTPRVAVEQERSIHPVFCRWYYIDRVVREKKGFSLGTYY